MFLLGPCLGFYMRRGASCAPDPCQADWSVSNKPSAQDPSWPAALGDSSPQTPPWDPLQKRRVSSPAFPPDSRNSLLGQGFWALRLIADPSPTTDRCLVIRTSNTRPITDKVLVGWGWIQWEKRSMWGAQRQGMNPGGNQSIKMENSQW